MQLLPYKLITCCEASDDMQLLYGMALASLQCFHAWEMTQAKYVSYNACICMLTQCTGLMHKITKQKLLTLRDWACLATKLNNNFHILNNITYISTYFFIYTYLKKLKIIILKLLYQTLFTFLRKNIRLRPFMPQTINNTQNKSK